MILGLTWTSLRKITRSFFKNTLLPTVYPRHCPVCHRVLPLGSFICTPCENLLPFVTEPFCCRCGKPVTDSRQEYCADCRRFPKSFHSGIALWLYTSCTQPSMMAFKYNNRRCLSSFFIDELLKKHRYTLLRWYPDAIVPVPVHRNRQKKRGYNQAELLAKDLSAALNLPCYPHLLLRILDTPPQKNYRPQARRKHMQNAFIINPRQISLLARLHTILLIDDIYTTGATMDACSRLLLSGGVKRVHICSLCIGLSVD